MSKKGLVGLVGILLVTITLLVMKNDNRNEDVIKIGAILPLSGDAAVYGKNAKEGIDFEDARMNIDVGGPSALRAAAKNWHRVLTVVDPDDYGKILEEMRANNGCTTLETRFELHKKVFRHLADYNTAIANFVEGVSTAG